jgi:hypothetical protein
MDFSRGGGADGIVSISTSNLTHAALRTGRFGDDQIVLLGFVQDSLLEIALERFPL